MGHPRSRRPRRRRSFPDILIVPLAAFDRAGHRIGYGAGYYDMTIRRLRAMKPVDCGRHRLRGAGNRRRAGRPHDERLDLVLTEREVIDCRGSA